MFKLEKLNVVRLVDSEHARDLLLADGFSLVEEPDDELMLKVDTVIEKTKKAFEKVSSEHMDVDGMTVKELQAYLDQQGIEFKAGSTKVELLKLAYGQ